MSHGIFQLDPDVNNLSQLSVVVQPATANLVGGVKIGAGLAVQPDGTLSVTGGGGGGQNQTPWLSDIQGAGYSLWNAYAVEVDGGLVGNAYTSGGWRYRAAGSAFQLQTSATQGTLFNTAPAGAAGALISFINGLTFADNSNVGVGTVSPAYKLDVSGSVNSSGCYYINGHAFACSDGANGINLSNITNINGSPPGTGTGGAVSSVFGRTGAVVAVSGDYTAAQVTNAVSTASTYADPAWITSLSYSKLTGTPAPYVLPAATATTLGGVIIGSGITVQANGTISVVPGAAFQTPWLSNIDAGQFQLNNASQINLSYPSPNRTGYLACNATGMTLATGAGTALSISAVNAITIASNITINSNASVPSGAAYTWGVTGGVNAMSIYANARVSIGLSTAPQYLLDLGGDVNTTGLYRINGVPLSASMITNAVDSTQSYANPTWLTSLAWSKITGAPATGVSTVFGRSGAVVAVSGDYTAAEVTNAVDSTQSYANPAWITSLAYSKITGAPAAYVLPPATTTVLGGVKAGSGITVQTDGTISVTPGAGGYWVGGTGGAIYYTGGIVGIGTSTPGSYPMSMTGGLVVSGTGATVFAVYQGSNVSLALNPSSSGAWSLYDYAAGSFQLSITSSHGNIGIGMTPVYRLDSAGDVNTTGVYRINGVPLAASQVTNAVDQTQTYANPAWISSLAYSKLTGTPAPYVLPAATASVLGGVKIGANVTVQADGTISVAAPTAPYVLPPATASVLGGVKIGSGVTVAGDGTISVTGGGQSQTPWLSDIQGAGYSLWNALNVQATGYAEGDTGLSVNIYNDGSNWRLRQTGAGLLLLEANNTGVTIWSAPSGAAGATANIRQAIIFLDNGETVFPTGNVGIGTTSPVTALDVTGNIHAGNAAGPNSMDLQTYTSGNWGVATWDTNMYWNGSSFVARNSGYPGLQLGASVLNNGTGDASVGFSYLPVGSSSIRQLFAAQMYQNFGYTTLSAGIGANIDTQLTTFGQWYTYSTNNTTLTFRMRGSDGVYRQGSISLA